MNRKSLLLFAICAAGAAFLWCWFLLTRDGDDAAFDVRAWGGGEGKGVEPRQKEKEEVPKAGRMLVRRSWAVIGGV